MSIDQPTTSTRPRGRPGITRQDVASAMDALAQRGTTDPSLLQLREHLGRGSNTTLARLRQEIRGEQLLATRTPVAGSLEATVLPVVALVMEKLGEEAAKAADAHIEAMRAEFESKNHTMAKARDEAEQALRDIKLEYRAREGQIADANETIRSLRSQISDEQSRCERLQAALTAQSTELSASERKAHERALKAENEAVSLNARLADAQRIIDAFINQGSKK